MSAPKQTVVYPSCTLQGEAYDDDGLATIDITIRPDYCILSF